MPASSKKNQALPGLDVVGRGIYLRPHQVYELKEILFPRDGGGQVYYSAETGQSYHLPDDYAINDSPPLPARQALNQVLLEESWNRFDKQMGMDAKSALSSPVFSVDASAGQTKHLRAEEEAYYALRSSFIPLWTVYLPDVTRVPAEMFDMDIPIPFKHRHRRVYERFFERYGSHYVKRAWVGGKAMLAFTILKSSQLSKDEIQAGIKASMLTFGDGTLTERAARSKQKLQNNSECTVFGKGGDELKLASLNSLDNRLYNEWLCTIKSNPQVIELEVAGIWTLLHDEEKARTLMEAYRAATAFTSVSAIFNIAQDIYFLRGNQYFCYNLKRDETEKPKLLKEKWPDLEDLRFEWVDAAVRGEEFISVTGENLCCKLFLFKRNKYVRIDISTGRVDEGYPKLIKDGWPGVGFESIDAVVNIPADAIYFFKGRQYIRYNINTHRADEGYPESIPRRWLGLTFDRLDAAIYWGNDKVYFFHEDQHIRFDMGNYRADPGYPKAIVGSYVEDWRFFD